MNKPEKYEETIVVGSDTSPAIKKLEIDISIPNLRRLNKIIKNTKNILHYQLLDFKEKRWFLGTRSLMIDRRESLTVYEEVIDSHGVMITSRTYPYLHKVALSSIEQSFMPKTTHFEQMFYYPIGTKRTSFEIATMFQPNYLKRFYKIPGVAGVLKTGQTFIIPDNDSIFPPDIPHIFDGKITEYIKLNGR